MIYDIDGKLQSHTRPDGSLIEYGYDARQLLSSLTADGPPPVADYSYNGRGQLETTAVESGLLKRSRSYDDAGRLTSIINSDALNTPLESTAYILDDAGQRTGITRNGVAVDPYNYKGTKNAVD